MTDRELEQAKRDLYFKYYEGKCRVVDNLKQPWTQEDRLLEEEYDCIDMINSLLCYGSLHKDCVEIANDRYLQKYVNVLGIDKVIDLIIAQQHDIVGIQENVHTDFEGVSYNSIIWVKK